MPPKSKERSRKGKIEPTAPGAGTPAKTAAKRAEDNLEAVADAGDEKEAGGAPAGAKKGRKRAADFSDPTSAADGKDAATADKPAKPAKKAKTAKDKADVEVKAKGEDGGLTVVAESVQPSGGKVNAEIGNKDKDKPAKAKRGRPTKQDKGEGAGAKETGDAPEKPAKKPKKAANKADKPAAAETAKKGAETAGPKADEAVANGTAVAGASLEKGDETVKPAKKRTKKVAEKTADAAEGATDAAAKPAEEPVSTATTKAKKATKKAVDSAKETADAATMAANETTADVAAKGKKTSKKAKAVAAEAKDAAAGQASAVADSLPAPTAESKPPPKAKKGKTAKAEGQMTSKLSKDLSSPVEDAMTKVSKKAPKRKAGEVEAEISGTAPAKKQKKEAPKSAAQRAAEAFNASMKTISDSVNAVKDSLGGFLGNNSVTQDAAEAAADATKATKGKKRAGKAVGQQNAAEAVASENVDQQQQEEEEDLDADDQTAALLKGFESDGEDQASDDEGFKPGAKLPKYPINKGFRKKLTDAKGDEEPGVVYIGHVPHGFHEHEMRAYFSQFGDINHVRLSRSKKTGRSKHYGFLEFKSAGVAKIAADAMHNYLMFNHILKCHVVPKDKVPPNLWKGADKRFKTVPWSKIQGRDLKMPQGQDVWDKRNEREKERRATKAEKMKEIGYEYTPPALKGAVDVLKERVGTDTEIVEETTVVSGGGDQPLTVSEEVKITKKPRKKPTKTAEAAVESVANGAASVAKTVESAVKDAQAEATKAVEAGKKTAKATKGKAKAAAEQAAPAAQAKAEEAKEEIAETASTAKKATEKELEAVKEGKISTPKEKRERKPRNAKGSS